MLLPLLDYKWPNPVTFFEEKISVNDYELDAHDHFILKEVKDSLDDYYDYDNSPENELEIINPTHFFSEDTILEMAELLMKICNKND